LECGVCFLKGLPLPALFYIFFLWRGALLVFSGCWRSAKTAFYASGTFAVLKLNKAAFRFAVFSLGTDWQHL